MVAILILLLPRNVIAFEKYPDMEKVRCTCHTISGTTASGKQTRKGIAAGDRAWLGLTAMVWKVDADGGYGDFIGFYEIEDTTKEDTGRLDIWVEDSNAVKDWQKNNGDYVYVILLDAKG